MYGTIILGDTYFATQLNADAWEDAEDTDKTKALTMATEIIDTLNFVGDKTDDDQANQFPRGDDTEVPTNILKANYEIGKQLLDGVDPEMELETLGMVSQRYATVQSTYGDGRIVAHILAGLPSSKAYRYLAPYLRDMSTVIVSRV